MKSSRRSGTKRALASALLTPALALVPASPAHAVHLTSVGGGAFGVRATGTLLAIPLNVGPEPTVTLAATGGGPFSDDTALLNLPGALKTGVLSVKTQGQAGTIGTPGFAESSASLANVALLNKFLRAKAVKSHCRADAAGVSGGAELVKTKISGRNVAEVNDPNTRLGPVPGGITVKLNEQIVATSGSTSSITVNAVHITSTVGGGLDVIIGQSRCSATT